MTRKMMLAAAVLFATAAIPLFGSVTFTPGTRGPATTPPAPPAPTVAPAAPALPDGILSQATLKTYADELHSAFPGQVDIYIVGKDFEYTKPHIADVHVVGCAQIAGVLHYVVRMANGSETFIPQSQIAIIHNRRG